MPKDRHESNYLVPSIPGDLRMPRFDKVLASTTPQGAAAGMVYHLTEMHNSTAVENSWILICWQQDFQQTMLRLANGSLNLFARGYTMPQMQIEASHRLRFNTSELASQQTWEISSGDGLLATILQCLSWEKNWVWTFNLPLNVQEILTTTDSKWPSVKQALEYSGLQALDHMDQQVSDRLKNLLRTVHPLLERPLVSSSNICYHGVKTPERLRGSPTLISWMNANKAENYSQYVAEINAYRLGEPTEGDNMDVDRDTDVSQG